MSKRLPNNLVSSAVGVLPMSMTPAEFDAYVRQEIEQNKALVNAIGIKAE